jgi:acyl-CoA reductase-like NAD-dependent aldehyde dehydrogenase
MARRFDNWIGGEWVGSGDVDPIVDPFGGEVVGEMALASAEDLERAIRTAV